MTSKNRTTAGPTPVSGCGSFLVNVGTEKKSQSRVVYGRVMETKIMTLIRLGTVVVLVTLLLSIISCDRFNGSSNGAKPTQVVDLPSVIGKSRQEITKMVGIPPYKDNSIVVQWELPEGTLSVFKEENGETDFISYALKKPYSGFVSSREMAAVVNVDVQRRKPEVDRHGHHRYNYISVNGKTFDLAVDNEGGRFADVRISNFEIGGEVTEGFKPTQVVDLPLMIGKSPQEITKIVGISPHKDDSTAVDWVLPEGRLSVFKARSFISYNLKSYSDFDPDRGVASPEEMAALVRIDIQGREPEKIRDGVVAYRNLSVNGKTLDLYIKMSDKRYMGAWIENFND